MVLLRISVNGYITAVSIQLDTFRDKKKKKKKIKVQKLECVLLFHRNVI